jgi:pimeloyl-ACP methyl ester carboxylesterase
MAETGFIERDGVRLHYLRWGSGGRAIVLLHGNSHCGGVWTPVATQLAADGFTVIAPDLRGHGRSDKPEHGYGWAFLRDDALSLLRRLELESVVLAGHSRGGGVCLLAASAAPERVCGVVVYEPTVPFRFGEAFSASPPPPETVTARLAERASRRRQTFPNREALIARYRERDTFAHWQDDVLRAFAEHGTLDRADGAVELACPPRVEAELYRQMLSTDDWTGAGHPRLPILAIFGERGGRIGPGRDPTAGLRALFPSLNVAVMPNASHYGPMEQPAYFAEAIRTFAGQVQQA